MALKSKLFLITVTFMLLNSSNWTINMIDSAKDLIGSNNKEFISKKDRYNALWKDSIDDFKEASNLELQKDKAVDSSWMFWKKTKKDIKDDIDSIINNIIEKIANIDLLEYKNKVSKYRDKIKELKDEISQLREEKIMDIPSNSSKYDEKIKELKNQIQALQKEIKSIHTKLKKSFRANKIELSAKQIDLLLDRVDGDDIIKMTVVLDVLKYINSQIAKLVKESKEDLENAKKYYAMHLVTLQIVVNIQEQYIKKVLNKYIPKLNDIEKRTIRLKKETEIKIDKEQDERRRAIYEKNLNSQKLTLKVIKLYKEHLLKSIENVKVAQDISIKNLELAENTLKTVLISADLYDTISESRGLFNRVISIQIPNITPFENIQIQKEFKNLTLELSR